MPTAWWFRPVKKQARVGEHRAVTWKRLNGRPGRGKRVECGVAMSDPKAPRCPNPVSSSTMATHVGRPGRRLGGVAETGGSTGRR